MHQQNLATIMETRQTIPVFFSVNDAYSPYLAVALNSIKKNASKDYTYKIHVLGDDISAANRRKLSRFSDDDFSIEFIPLSETLRGMEGVSSLQNHRFAAFASLTIYFRLFIPAIFPQYDKAIYLDSDIIVPGDISKLWETDLGDKLVGACADYSIQHIGPFMKYIDEYIGVDHRRYVNSGVLLMNLEKLRSADMAGRFLSWMRKYGCATVAPDQDYLNALCWDCIYYLDPAWDTMPSGNDMYVTAPRIIHFNLDTKPWMNREGKYHDLFWKYAADSGYYRVIRSRQKEFLADRSRTESYRSQIEGLVRLAAELTKESSSFRSIINTGMESRLCYC